MLKFSFEFRFKFRIWLDFRFISWIFSYLILRFVLLLFEKWNYRKKRERARERERMGERCSICWSKWLDWPEVGWLEARSQELLAGLPSLWVQGLKDLTYSLLLSQVISMELKYRKWSNQALN